ncbi:twin-arginine translocation signal domain-containing protein, partial [Klebsiella pneumoniae]
FWNFVSNHTLNKGMRMLLKTSRRTFLKGLTLFGVAGSLGVWSFNARSSLSLPVAASLQGTQFDLTIGETAVNITGSERQAKTINGVIAGARSSLQRR